MTDKPLSIAIIGGGIGGLSAALSLLHAGFDVHVYEQARGIGEIGAGIQISPNAARILHRFGLSEAMAKTGVKPLYRHQRRWDDGRTLTRAPLGDEAEKRYGAPYYNFHRADFIALLAAALPAERLHVDHRFDGLTDHGDKVEARFANGARTTSDLLIGADGIHSGVRSAILGPEAPTFTGCIAYRGLVPVERIRHLDFPVEAQNWVGPGQHFVQYYVASQRLMNVVCVIEREAWSGESWTQKGEVADLLAAFAGWHPQLLSLIGAIEETYQWGLYDRPPLETWSAGRVTLLGDSCHAMLPFMAQGAVQSIEDGAALAACLSGVARAGIPAALARYQTVRQPRASKLQVMSRANKTNFHLPDGPAQQERDARMALGTAGFADNAMAWLYEHDASVITGS
jgi:salicylate hydroxylase